MATQKRFIAKNGLDNNAQTITNVATPVNTTDAVTKAYADLKPDLSSTTPAALGTAAVGTGTTAARADHVHQSPTTITGNAGTATSIAGGTTNGVLYQSGSGVTASTGASTAAGQVLTTTTLGGVPSWQPVTATTATTSTNVAGGVLGAVPYQSAANTTAMTAAGAAGTVLTTVTAGGAPTWVTPTAITLSSAITGYVAGANTALAATDTILAAFGKLQGQVTARGVGTVTGVTATAPVASTGGTAPVISMAAATTSASGYLTSTDWNTFNGKYSVGGALGTPSSGTVTNLTGTASININGTVGVTTPNLGYFSLVNVGAGTGGVALSTNDGYGNANVCFNHYGGTPDNSSVGAGLSSAGRITCSVDSATASLQFQLANATTSAVIPAMTAVATMYTTGITCGVNLTAPVLISNVATGTAPLTVTSTTPVANLSIGGNAATATSLSTVTGTAPSYACRAWVNFNGTGIVAIRASGNVSSITDNGGNGNYTVNFTTAMLDANYAAVANCNGVSGSSIAPHMFGSGQGIASYTASSVQLMLEQGGVAAADREVVTVAIFR